VTVDEQARRCPVHDTGFDPYTALLTEPTVWQAYERLRATGRVTPKPLLDRQARP
jgi:hypothetical protein